MTSVYPIHRFETHLRGRVNPDYGVPVFATLRSVSQHQSADQIGQLWPSTEFEVLARAGRELLILVDDGGGGWIDADGVELLD